MGMVEKDMTGPCLAGWGRGCSLGLCPGVLSPSGSREGRKESEVQRAGL